MFETLLTIGIACILAAIVGGGFKGMGIEIPVIQTFQRQLVLAIAGISLSLPAVVERYREFYPDIDISEELTQGLAAYDSGDFMKALVHFKNAAHHGQAEAQYHYGEMLFHGEGVIPNVSEAVDWIRKSAERGFAAAQASLASAYISGTGVPKDSDAALMWAKRSADQDDPFGLHILGQITKNTAESSRLLIRAAEKDYAPAQVALGEMLVKKDIDIGERPLLNVRDYADLFEKAAQQGHQEAQAYMAHLMVGLRQKEAAHKWLCIALQSLAPRAFLLDETSLAAAQKLKGELERELPYEVAVKNKREASTFKPIFKREYRHGH
jgi:TPR repeat protein